MMRMVASVACSTCRGQEALLKFLRFGHSLESDFAALIGRGSTVGDRTFAELRVPFIDRRHKPCIAQLIKQVRLMGLLGSQPRERGAA
jgi:hypothetical protein